MIPAFFGTFQKPAQPTSITVIDIGGTNVRSAVVTVGESGKCFIEKRIAFRTPGVDEETDTIGFFSEIASRVREYLSDSYIGICFSLAAIPQKDRDAIMAAGGKQIRIRDMIGKKVGESFRGALRMLGLPCRQKITVVNDTVAAALSGRSETNGKTYSNYIGFIYGTGTNLCYQEPAGDIINVESGAYCGFPSGDIDDAYDLGMIDPGEDRFEKMVSGGYQGGLMEHILRTAAGEAILSKDTINGILNGHSLSAADISAFSKNPYESGLISHACASEEDRRRIVRLFDAVTDRSACLCSITITAALLSCKGMNIISLNKGRPEAGAVSPLSGNPSLPAFITVEGSTYQKQHRFREMLGAHMASLARDRYYLAWEFHNVPDAILKGTAIACLSK